MTTFVNRDYGPRAVPAEAVVIGYAGDEEDVTVYAWAEAGDEDTLFVQQGYDLISLSREAVVALAALLQPEAQQ